MGPSVHSSDITADMKSCVIALAFVTLVFSAPMVPEDDFDYDVAYETYFIQTEAVTDLKNVVGELKKVAPEHLQGHVAHMAEHAEFLQDGKANAHDFAKSKKAIEAAIEALNNDLDAGHNHDVAALKTAAADNKNHVANTDSKNKRSVHGVRNKACPTKRAEEKADEEKKAAKGAMDGIYNTKICGISTTWRDMDIEKDAPKMGTVLRNKWDATRAKYVAAKNKYDAAVKAHQSAINAHAAAMEAFKTALAIQAAATLAACEAAKAEYEILKRDVASNVVTRKQTFVAALVIKCYTDNMTNNAADNKRSANTSKFNINPPGIGACKSKGENSDSYGPASWKPTKANC